MIEKGTFNTIKWLVMENLWLLAWVVNHLTNFSATQPRSICNISENAWRPTRHLNSELCTYVSNVNCRQVGISFCLARVSMYSMHVWNSWKDKITGFPLHPPPWHSESAAACGLRAALILVPLFREVWLHIRKRERVPGTAPVCVCVFFFLLFFFINQSQKFWVHRCGHTERFSFKCTISWINSSLENRFMFFFFLNQIIGRWTQWTYYKI